MGTISANRIGAGVSREARTRLASARAYPTLDSWRNPVTRGLARRLVNDALSKTIEQIDFDYRFHETSRGEIPCVRYETRSSDPHGAIILYVHGGGFLAGSPLVNASTILPLCESLQCEAIGAQYSLLPEAPYPVALNEIDQVYQALIGGAQAPEIILCAESTGAALAMANVLRWRDSNIKLPKAIVLFSPCLDGTGKSDSQFSLDGRDPFFRSFGGKTVRQLFKFYAPGEDLESPLISPLYGDFSGLPPVLVQAGIRDVMLGDATRFATLARRQGVDIGLQIFDGLFHQFHMHWSAPEVKDAFSDAAVFVKEHAK